MLKLLCPLILISQLSAVAQASEFIEYYKGASAAVSQPVAQTPVVQPAAVEPILVNNPTPIISPAVVTPAITAPAVVENGTSNNLYSQYLPSGSGSGNTTGGESGDTAEVIPIDSGDNGGDSEIVNGPGTQVQVVAPIPMPRPQTPVKPAAPATPAPPITVGLYDLSNCAYHHLGQRACWAGVSVKAKMQKIIADVGAVNKLHGTQFDARYLLCTGWRESSYDPGVLGGDGERGMFQVMKFTGKTSLLNGGPPLIPEFKNYRNQPETYMTKMSNSTLAQTELSYMVLKTIGKMFMSSRQQSDIFSGKASIETYRQLATHYNGAGPRAVRYGNAISNCLSCMRSRTALPDVTKDFNYDSVKGCLAKAKVN